MRSALACGWLVCCQLWAGSAQGDEPTFPYTIQVAADEAEVRSGPGWHYYVTQRLPRGVSVEVYRHDPGGWLAIRPPRESFSWVAARHVQLTDDPQVAEVVQDATVAWIGSALSVVPQHKWQVRMDRGELVEVVGEQAMTVGPGFATEKYYKVAPPAGEFRWIHQRQAAGSGPASDRASNPSNQTTSVVQHIDAARQAAGPPQSLPSNAGATTVRAAPSEVPPRLASLRVDLSLLVTQPIEQWDLKSLGKRAAELAQAAHGTSAEQEVKAVVARIEEFETLRRRHEKAQDGTAPALDEDVAAHGVSVTPQLEEPSRAVDLESAIGSGLDSADTDIAPDDSPPGTAGWLMPVHSTRRVAPPFALLDDDGRVAAYVTPAPGLNLRRYVKQRVAIVGDQRYATELRAAHITAERVVKRR